jgi:hypothetical protein
MTPLSLSYQCLSPQYNFRLPTAAALCIYLYGLYNEMLVPQVMYIHTE